MSKELGIERRAIGDDEIFERCLYSMINEGAKILEEGIALRASDIDTVWINGYGFPPHRGGPMFYADTVGLPKIYETLQQFVAKHGKLWKPSALLEKLAREDKTFASFDAGAPRPEEGSIAMREAVIVSTARTPIGKAYRGAFNNLEAPTMGAHAIREAVRRAQHRARRGRRRRHRRGDAAGHHRVQPGRASARSPSGLPVTVSGMTVDRQCASGLMAIATAAKAVIVDGMPIVVGGGLESISLVQNEHRNGFRVADPTVMKLKPELYMAMLDTAEVVAKRYKVVPRGAGRLFAREPAAHRGGSGERQVRRRDRPGHLPEGRSPTRTPAP